MKEFHRQDAARGAGRVYLPFALEPKYPNAARELIWQYVFPAAKLSARRKPALRFMLDEKMFAFYYELSSNSR